MMRPIDDNQQRGEESAFDIELERFFKTRPVSVDDEYPGIVCGRVKAETVRIDRAFRVSVYGVAASLLLSVIVWFGVFSAEGDNVVGVEEPATGEFYTEIHMLEEMLYGAEALGDEDALDTLALLIGG